MPNGLRQEAAARAPRGFSNHPAMFLIVGLWSGHSHDLTKAAAAGRLRHSHHAASGQGRDGYKLLFVKHSGK